MTSYPILILCDGSESKGDVGSVLYIRGWFSSRIEPLNVGFLTVEKWGIDGSNVNEEEFWNHYTRSQRLEDHLKVIHHFEKNPPDGWNGKFIFMGVSEGGPLVTDLSTICSNTLATINWVGAGDWSWADEFWQFFESKKQNSTWITPSDIPQTKQEYDAFVQYIIHHPTPNERMGGMTYLYHADAFRRPSIDYRKIRSPFLVVIGTEDSNLASSDQFVQKAQEAGAPLTYFRVSGMDHYIRKRPDVVDQSFSWLQEQLLQTNS
jgi:acetyl esterase/lipase